MGSFRREHLSAVFPNRPIVDIENADSIFHSVYDLDDRYQILGQWAITGQRKGPLGGNQAQWKGIYDDHQRLMVAISFNSRRLAIPGSGPTVREYPERYSALGIRIGVNYVMYDLTH